MGIRKQLPKKRRNYKATEQTAIITLPMKEDIIDLQRRVKALEKKTLALTLAIA